MDSTIKALHRNVGEWLAGPAGAAVVHLLLVLALLLLVDFSPRPDKPETYEVAYIDPVEQIIDPAPPPLDPFENVPPEPSVFDPAMQVLNPEPEAPPPIEIFTQDTASDLPDLGVPPAFGAVVIENLPAGAMHQRMGDRRHEAGEAYGGPWAVPAEQAVVRALEWLRVHQQANGSWGAHDPEALSGLAVLTFLAHGETTASERYGETVKRALQYLLARQNAAGAFANTDTTAGTYAQAICVYALGEAYGMTRIAALKPALEQGAQVLIDGQQAGGGFDYRFAKADRRDTSLGGWCSQALKAAFIAGAENPQLKTAMDLATADMKAAQQADGSFFYSHIGRSHATPGISAVGVLSLQLLGHGRDPAVRRGLDFLQAADCNWKNPPAWPMYAWYYIAQTKFHEGGSSWKSWNSRFAPEFIRHQNADGSWTSAGLGLKSGAEGRENLDPVYATTLAALTLQVYHRNLPTYQPLEEQAVDQTSGDDIRIDVL